MYHVVGLVSKNWGNEGGFVSTGSSMSLDVRLTLNWGTGPKEELAFRKIG